MAASPLSESLGGCWSLLDSPVFSSSLDLSGKEETLSDGGYFVDLICLGECTITHDTTDSTNYFHTYAVWVLNCSFLLV